MKKKIFLIIFIVLAIVGITIYFIYTKNNKKDGNNQVEQDNRRNFKLEYMQTDNKEITDVYNAGEYMVKTYGGDVTITIEDDMVYELKDALENQVITSDDIINQGIEDTEKGVCQEEVYKDGGTREYRYPTYTIIKFNSLGGNKDLYIAMANTGETNIVSDISKNLDKNNQQ